MSIPLCVPLRATPGKRKNAWSPSPPVCEQGVSGSSQLDSSSSSVSKPPERLSTSSTTRSEASQAIPILASGQRFHHLRTLSGSLDAEWKPLGVRGSLPLAGSTKSPRSAYSHAHCPSVTP